MYTGEIRRTQGHNFNAVLQRRHAEALIRVTRGLENAGATLADGRLVTDASKAIRWILENVQPVKK